MKKLNNVEGFNTELLNRLTSSIEKISDALFLKSLMEYRTYIEDKITEIESSNAKKAIWDLCDGTKKITEIAESLGYSSHSGVSNHIKTMLDDDVIFNKRIGSENYPISVDALIVQKIKSDISN